MEPLKDRPPYVKFEVRPIEDRNASIVAGYYVTRDVDFALITPQGSKDQIELNVAEWFKMLEQEVSSKRFPAEWLAGFKSAYSHWKEGREIPLSGFPVINWPALSPSQVNTFLEMGIRTIEDVAVMNEEAITHLGMGGRSLKQRAIDWLSSAESIGKPSEALSALKQENEMLKAQVAALEARVKDLTAASQEVLANIKASKSSEGGNVK